MDPRLNEAELDLRARARTVATESIAATAADADAGRRFPIEAWRALANAGLNGAWLDAAAGGSGGLLEMALVVEEVARASASVGAALATHAVVGLGLARFGSDQQQRTWSDGMRGEQCRAALAVSPGGTTLEDPGAEVRREGDGPYRLEGSLPMVTGAAGAGLLLVAARAEGGDPDLFLVPSDRDGVAIAEEPEKLGLNGSGAAAVALSAEASEDDRLCKGQREFDRVLDWSRLAFASVAVGVAQASLDAALLRVRDDEGTLGRSQAVQWMLADSATETEAARLLVWEAASLGDDAGLSEAAAGARLMAAQAAAAAARRSVQIFGSDGNLRERGVERLFRDAKALEVHEGASDAQRLVVARHLLPDLTR